MQPGVPDPPGGARPSRLGGPKQRTVLALLLQNANELLPRERVVAAVWGEDAPPQAAARLRAHVARLRKALETETHGRAIVESRRDGYVLRVDDETQRGLAERIQFRLRPAAPRRRPAPPRAGRRVLALATVAVLALAAAVAAGSGQLSSSSLNGNSAVAIDPRTDAVLSEVALGGRPGGIAVGNGSIWVGNRDSRTLLRIGVSAHRVAQTIGLDLEPIGVAYGGGSVWVLGREGTVLEVDPTIGRVVARVAAARGGCCAQDIAFARGAAWVAQAGALTRIAADTKTVQRTGFRNVRSIASTRESLWGVLGTRFERIRQLKPLGSAVRVQGVDTIDRLGGVSTDRRSLWAASEQGTLRRISPRTGRVMRSVSLNRPVADAAVAPGGAVWVGLR